MEFWSQEFWVGYIWYIFLPALIYYFTIWVNINLKNNEKIWWFVTIAIIIFVYYWNYINEANMVDCILSYYDKTQIYSKEEIINKCSN